MIDTRVMFTDEQERASEWAISTKKPTGAPPEPPSKEGNASAPPRPPTPPAERQHGEREAPVERHSRRQG
jgi:hypothetical protein